MGISETETLETKLLAESMNNGVNDVESEISKFLDARSVFLTGVTGFLGKVILATVLTYCTGLKKIYVLLRSKKGLEPTERLNEILKKKIFHKLPESCPEYLTKIVVVPGDVSEENLGISEQRMCELEENVSVVIHCAAAVSFSKPLGYMMKQNVIGTENVVKLCRRLKELAVMTYVSTAYSFCNKFEIDETVPMLEVPPKEFMEAARLGDEDKLLKLSKLCHPPWPNSYTFSKAITENYLTREVKDIPLTILRPSIVFCSWKGLLPGYVEEGFGFTDGMVYGARGFIRVFYCDPDKVFDIIPVDIVVNTLLSAANYVYKNKPKEAFVVNCVSGNLNPMKLRDISQRLQDMHEAYPLPNTYQKPNFTITKNAKHYWISFVVNHYAPAVVIDLALMIMGKKPKLTKSYLFAEKFLEALKYFTTNEWHYKCENYEMLIKTQTSKGKKIFPIDIREMDTRDLWKNVRNGAPFYDWSRDKRGFAGRMAIAYKRYIITQTIKWITITLTFILFASSVYWLCSFIFEI